MRWKIWKIYRFAENAAGRGRALLRICVGGRKSEVFGGTIPVFAVATGRDGTFVVVFVNGWTNVAFDVAFIDDGCTNVAFAFSFDTGNDSGVSPRLELLFELPDDRLYKIKKIILKFKKIYSKITLKLIHINMFLTLFDANRPKSVSESVRLLL